MPDKRIPLANGEFYHVYNRGTAKQPVFLQKTDYKQIISALSYYRFAKPPMKFSRYKEISLDERSSILSKLIDENKTLINITTYTLMPNHFHFLLQQLVDNGISKFLSNLTNSFTKFFNTKYERLGPIFQGTFKAKHIETNEQLLHVNRYIHINPVVSNIILEKDLEQYEWSSLPDYLQEKQSIVHKEPILSQFSSIDKYKEFIYDHIEYAKHLNEIKHLIME